MKFTQSALALAVSLSLCSTLGSPQLQAATGKKAPSVKDVQKELQTLKDVYGKKIKELEERLDDAEDTSEDSQESIEQLEVDVSQQSNQKSANTFNPGIGVVLNGRYVNYSDTFAYDLPGFFPAAETGPGDQGLQLGESELNMSANVDDKFYASVTIAVAEGAEVEEAFLQTLNLGNGFNIKAGRFFSDIGYLTSHHTHTDDFANRPLPYTAFLGGQFGDAGVQTTWLAPTDTYWESGFELYRGDSFPSAGASNSGKGTWTAFSHVGGDIGNSQSWRAGMSYLHADVDGLESENGDSFSGENKLFIADFIYRWNPNGNRLNQGFKLQGEYLSNNRNGSFSNNTLTDEGLDFDQSGWYLEGVYRFARQWRVGVRTSRLSSDNLPSIFNGSLLDSLGHSPKQNSIMLDWTNSEFSRLRLQMDSNNLAGDNENVLTLQYIAAFGAHGAHSY